MAQKLCGLSKSCAKWTNSSDYIECNAVVENRTRKQSCLRQTCLRCCHMHTPSPLFPRDSDVPMVFVLPSCCRCKLQYACLALHTSVCYASVGITFNSFALFDMLESGGHCAFRSHILMSYDDVRPLRPPFVWYKPIFRRHISPLHSSMTLLKIRRWIKARNIFISVRNCQFHNYPETVPVSIGYYPLQKIVWKIDCWNAWIAWKQSNWFNGKYNCNDIKIQFEIYRQFLKKNLLTTNGRRKIP